VKVQQGDKMKTIIIVNGYAESGKDTFCKYMKEISDIPTKEYSIIDYPKEVATEYLWWNGKKDEKGRKLLSDLKNTMMKYNQLPLKKIYQEVGEMRLFHDSFLFLLHMRKPKEIQMIKDFYEESDVNVITLFIEREACVREWRNEDDDGVENYDYDYILTNNIGLKEFKYKTIGFYKTIIVNMIEKEENL
jgi:hypothetical protein